jgi:uncharacterized NAD(P)/FAD-binding protein YdhS
VGFASIDVSLRAAGNGRAQTRASAEDLQELWLQFTYYASVTALRLTSLILGSRAAVLAYSTSCDAHLLNVPAIQMSAFGDEPRHFLDWLQGPGVPSAEPSFFAPRKLYGMYIQELLEITVQSASSRNRLRHHLSEAVRINAGGLSVSVHLRNDDHLQADKIVLALGNPASRCLFDSLPGYYPSPWQPDVFRDLGAEKEVLVVGAGLTAVNALLVLVSQAHRGRIHMLSRTGKLPHPRTLSSGD